MPDTTNNGRKISKNNTSGYTGVSFESVAGKYRAYVHYSGEKIALGYFPTAVEAARARAEAQQFYKMPLVDRLRLVDYLSDKFGLSAEDSLSGVIAALNAFRWGERINITTFTTEYVRKRVGGAGFGEIPNPHTPSNEILTQWLNGMSMARIARSSGKTAAETERELAVARTKYLRECYYDKYTKQEQSENEETK